jgi:hypothetical protein
MTQTDSLATYLSKTESSSSSTAATKSNKTDNKSRKSSNSEEPHNSLEAKNSAISSSSEYGLDKSQIYSPHLNVLKVRGQRDKVL